MESTGQSTVVRKVSGMWRGGLGCGWEGVQRRVDTRGNGVRDGVGAGGPGDHTGEHTVARGKGAAPPLTPSGQITCAVGIWTPPPPTWTDHVCSRDPDPSPSSSFTLTTIFHTHLYRTPLVQQ